MLGRLTDSIVQLASLPVLVAAFLQYKKDAGGHLPWSVLLLGTAILVVPITQLAPLPASLWTALPGHGTIAATFQTVGLQLPWMPLSLSPDSTWYSLLSLLPVFAVFFGVLLLDHRERRYLAIMMLVFGFASVVLGLAQLMQGTSSPLRFYEVTNREEAVGLFVNRNHYAAFLYALMPLTAACAVWLAMSPRAHGSGESDRRIVGIVALLLVFATLVLGVGMSRSRAGIGLAFVATLASVALAWPYRKSHLRFGPRSLLFGSCRRRRPRTDAFWPLPSSAAARGRYRHLRPIRHSGPLRSRR